MRRLIVLAILPLVLFGLETVNLIKDAGFEKDSDVWLMNSYADGEYDSTIINRHDPDSAYLGNFCGSIDGRIQPTGSLPSNYWSWGLLYQIYFTPKRLSDLDSIEFSHMVIPRQEDNKLSAWHYDLKLAFFDPSDETRIEVWYRWSAPDLSPPSDEPTFKMFFDTLYAEGEWQIFKCDIDADLVGIKGLSPEIGLDTFILNEGSFNYTMWRSQKVFFDDIRLTGYADYDVGVKEILSGDSLEEDTPYTPVARIKNFGREDAPEFSVIAEIFDGETRLYYDSLPWSLTSDTEDTVTFAAFTPSGAANHTLTVRTSMSPDESDEDDEVSRTLFGTAVAEQPGAQAVALEIEPLAANPRFAYFLPAGQSGTISIYDALGRKVEKLRVQDSGQVELPSFLSSGVYFLKLESDNTSITRKTVVLR